MPNTKYSITPETRKKMSISHLGKKVSGFRKIGWKLSNKTKVKMSMARKGIKRPKFSEVWKKNLSESAKKRITSPENRLKMSETAKKMGVGKWNKGRTGAKCHLWKGGITPINKLIRSSQEYRLWRESVFKRDNYKCIWCGAYSTKDIKVVINADHIKPFAYFPELRFAIDNGRTLCIDCHKTTDTYGNKIRNCKK